MKIAELLVRVHNLYPHSLKTAEMIDFCNGWRYNGAKV